MKFKQQVLKLWAEGKTSLEIAHVLKHPKFFVDQVIKYERSRHKK